MTDKLTTLAFVSAAPWNDYPNGVTDLSSGASLQTVTIAARTNDRRTAPDKRVGSTLALIYGVTALLVRC
jgi:hypothetical protein